MLGYGNIAQVDDRLITRQNITLARTNGTRTAIRNGDRWLIRHVHRNDDLAVEDGQRRARLPCDYLSRHA